MDELTPIAAAQQLRLINDARSARGQERIDRETETNTRAYKAQHLQKLIAAETQRYQAARDQQRTDFDASLSERARFRDDQRLRDRIDNANPFSIARHDDELTKRINQRNDERQMIADREANLQELLHERDVRLEKREAEARKIETRQQTDLRLAEDRIRLFQAPEGLNDGNHWPRGGIVDVSG